MENQLRSDYMLHQLERSPEYESWARDNTQKILKEIKGRHNEEDLQGDVLDKVRDVVRSQDWSITRDLDNAKLIDARGLAAGRYIDMPAFENAVKSKFGTLYLTPEEANQAQSILETAPKPADSSFAKGGAVERVSGDNRRYL